MKRILGAAAMALLLTGMASAQQAGSGKVLNTVPGNAFTVTDYYKQNVYDPSNNKIGEIKDVLIDESGKIDALIIDVGGFLGAGAKDVAVPFNAVKGTKKDNKYYLTMNANKDELKNAQGFTYDKNSTKWIAENKK